MSTSKRPRNTGSGTSSDPNGAGDSSSAPHTQGEERLPLHSGGAGGRPGFSIKPEGESGRKGIHPLEFIKICFRSTCTISMYVNLLWPVVPVAIAVNYALPDNYIAIFTLSYIAMIPAANTIGFAGQELGRKLPHVFGVILETTFGSVVEIVLFAVLVVKNQIQVVRAAILGSILANLLLCLGMCFIAGGIHHSEQRFHEAVSEVGSGLMLVAAMGLITPAIFALSTTSNVTNFNGVVLNEIAEAKILHISRATAIILLISYGVYVYFNMSSHHGLMTEVYEGDEERDRDRHEDHAKKKLTLTECVIALVISITCVSLVAVFLVENIEPIVHEGHVSDAFMGLILVPLVEKLAEHLTAIDESFDGMANLALAHVLGASLQTALLNTPIVVFIGWGLDRNMDLNFKQFEAVVLILSVLVLGNFLRDGKSNYLEGVLCVFVYVIIAIVAWYYPNPHEEELLLAVHTPNEGGGHHALRMLTGR